MAQRRSGNLRRGGSAWVEPWTFRSIPVNSARGIDSCPRRMEASAPRRSTCLTPPRAELGYAYEVGRNLPEMLKHIENLLTTCPGNCERSCTKCLRHYGNRFLHPRLDRRLGLQLLRYARFSVQPSIPASGEQRNTLEPLARFLTLEGWSVKWADSALVATPENGSKAVAIGTYPALLAKAEAEKRHALSRHSGGIPILLPDYLVERDLPSAYQEVMKHVKV